MKPFFLFFKELKLNFIGEYCSAKDLCFALNLDNRFLRLGNKERYNLELVKVSGVIFVKLPDWVRGLLEDGYQGFVIRDEDDLKELSINKIYQISKKTKIGFWK